MLDDADFRRVLERARRLRAQVDELDHHAEIDAAVRARVQPIVDPPEPPPRHGVLIAEILELLEDARLSPYQAKDLERAFFEA
ncbi:MAG TPA: hypothetical protein VK926_06130 [Gaiellaceae bacterium]|nr:hypothetical protein [Gaiellaceae bacterium]